ncbi:MAG: Tetratricopeptide repeat-containing protein [Cenarchaeum symbiont of Oopsacas minuta]|nr:Tetratricopeptide repeat-containing protein [Cenarchaeum symbiont of Oopsacas minuta]
MKKSFKRKILKESDLPVKSKPGKVALTDSDYQLKKFFKKGVNFMADEKLEEACEAFEQALRIDPNNVDAMLKLGYSRFHLDDYAEALSIYDRILDLDVTNSEAWNLKSLVHYEQKNYAKALDCTEKSIDSDPTFGMAWYNKACYLSILNQIPQSIDALKRSIEIDVKNARKSVKDKDFTNVRAEDGFKRIIEVVVIESVRQGYHTIGSIVWTTFLSKIDVQDALRKLIEKGLIIQNEKREGLHRIPIYDLADNVAKNMNVRKKNIFGISVIKTSDSVNELKEISHSVQEARAAIKNGDADSVLECFEPFVDNKRHGTYMIERFFEDHREIRLWKIRIKDHGSDYIHENKKKMLTILENIDAAITKQLRIGIS